MISRIEGPGPIRTASPVRRTAKASESKGSSFSKHLEEAEGLGSAQSASGLNAVSGVLNVQEVDDALTRAARGKLRAEDLLKKLDELRLDLLSGTLNPTTLQRLTAVVQSHKEEVEDPHLSEILDEIDLRAQVELAKFTRS